jgi:hypothetical protein
MAYLLTTGLILWQGWLRRVFRTHLFREGLKVSKRGVFSGGVGGVKNVLKVLGMVLMVLSFLIGACSLFLMSLNGRFQAVYLTSGVVVVVDTRDGYFTVSHVSPVSETEVRVRHLRNR